MQVTGFRLQKEPDLFIICFDSNVQVVWMMPQKFPISVFIIARDEADRIGRAIASVSGRVDEIIVIDSGSEDNTVEVSEKLGAKVVYNEWQGYGRQKIFGQDLCRNDWILNLDADEELSPKLAETIKELFSKNKQEQYSAYKMRWKMLFMSDEKPPLFAPGSTFIRLYNRQYAGFRDSTIHDSVVVHKGDTGNLAGWGDGVVYHRCFRNLRHWVEKINAYSTMQAEDMARKGRKISRLRIIFEPPLTFLKAYFLRRYFLYGINGFIGSFLYSYARLLRLAKAREICQNKPLQGSISD